MSDCSKDMEHQFAGGRGRIDAFLEADEVDVVCLEVLDRFEQFLERTPEAVEAGDTEAVAGAGMVDQRAQPGALGDEPALKVGNHSKDVEHQFVSCRCRVNAFFEAGQVNITAFEVLDGFEQFLEGVPEAVETGDTKAITRADMVDELTQPRAPELPPGDRVDEDANGAGLPQSVFLAGHILISRRHAA